MSANAGTLVIAPVRPPSSADQFPVALANEIAGGHHQVATLADRDAIPAPRLVDGMLVHVLADDSTWRRRSGVWVDASAGDVWQENRDADPLPAGMPVVPHPGGYGVLTADAMQAVPACGLVVAQTPVGHAAAVRGQGRLTLPTWLPVLGLADLPPRARLWLAPGGGLSLTPPADPGCILQAIGSAVDARTIAIALDPTPILRS